MKNLFKILLCGFALTAFVACNDDPEVEPDTAGSKGLISKDCEDRVEISGSEQDITISFETSGAWTAKLSNTAFASLRDEDKSGEAGQNQIVVSFKQNTSDASRIVTLSVTIGSNKSAVTLCRFTQRSLSQKGTDANVNLNFTWKWMNDYYLWNEDLRAALPSPNYEQPYDEFLEYLLKSINTNTMDGYYYPSRTATNKEWIYYSNIVRYSATGTASLHSATRAKEAVVGFGAEVEPMMFDYSGNLYFTVLWVYPKSPAATAGLKRGDFIGKINGSLINASNYYQLLVSLYYPNNGDTMTVSLCDYDFDNGRASYPEGCDKTIVAEYYYDTPVVYSTIFTTNETSAVQKKIGYLVYTSFESSYDDDLRTVFDEFKAKGITDIILDLRYNGGGAVSSSMFLTSVLAGPSCADKVFMYYRYNDERMKQMGIDKTDYKKYNPLKFDSSSATTYGFDFDKIYIIGTYDTASASELVINALRGIDKEVVLVGTETNGKNVGMEVVQTTQPIDGYYYTFAPISFQSYNAKGQSDYDDGFIPDRAIDFSNVIPRDWGEAFIEEGDKVYYADYVGVCLDLILSSASEQASIGRKAISRSGRLDIQRLKSPRSYIRRNGMYVEYQEPEEK